MKLNYRDPLWALALIIMALVLAWQCEGRKSDKLQAELDNHQLSQDTAHYKAQIRAANAQVKSIQKERTLDSQKFEASKTSLMQSVSRWRSEALKNRPAVVVMADSVPVLNAFLAATDSVIQQQDSVISVQSLHLVSQAKLYENELGVMGAMNLQQQQLTETWKNAYIKGQNDLKKARRPVSLGISAGPGIIVTPTGQVYGGLTANVGVSFRLRFRK